MGINLVIFVFFVNINLSCYWVVKKDSLWCIFCLPESEKRVIISANLVTNRDNCMQLFYRFRQEEASSLTVWRAFCFLYTLMFNLLRSGFSLI